MVHIVTPTTGDVHTFDAAANRRVQAFAQDMFPALARVLPS
jgi:hypothetical protein